MANNVPVGLSESQLLRINKLSDREFSISRTKTKKNPVSPKNHGFLREMLAAETGFFAPPA